MEKKIYKIQLAKVYKTSLLNEQKLKVYLNERHATDTKGLANDPTPYVNTGVLIGLTTMQWDLLIKILVAIPSIIWTWFKVINEIKKYKKQKDNQTVYKLSVQSFIVFCHLIFILGRTHNNYPGISYLLGFFC